MRVKISKKQTQFLEQETRRDWLYGAVAFTVYKIFKNNKNSYSVTTLAMERVLKLDM